MKPAFLLLFLAATAAAQPFVSEPVAIAAATRPTMQTRLAPAMSIARDGDGFVAAWSGGTAINAARLDASLQPVAPVREIHPYLGDAYEANYPDIAPLDGGGYALVWLERENIWQPRNATAVLSRFNAVFEPSPPVAVGPLPDSGLARIAGGGAGAVSVLVQGNVVALDRNGVATLALINTWAVDDAVAAGAEIALAARAFDPGQPPCSFPTFQSACWRPATWELKVQIGAKTFSQVFTGELAPPAIGFGGGMHLVAWLIDANEPGGRIAAARIRDGAALDSFAHPLILGGNTSAPSRPSIAWDGERFLVAWQVRSASDPTSFDIAAAALTPDGRVQPFNVADTTADERNPIVTAVKPGRFVLAYEVAADAGRRQLVARTIDFKVFRRRAAR